MTLYLSHMLRRISRNCSRILKPLSISMELATSRYGFNRETICHGSSVFTILPDVKVLVSTADSKLSSTNYECGE